MKLIFALFGLILSIRRVFDYDLEFEMIIQIVDGILAFYVSCQNT